MTVAPRTYSSPGSPGVTTRPSSPTTMASSPAMATPIDTGGSSSAGTVVTRWYVHTLVSVGPYRLA